MSNKSLKATVVTYSIMIRGLCKEDLMEDLSLEMEGKGCAPNAVAFNTLMHGLFQNNETQKAIDFLHKMKVRKLSPDASTVSMVIELLSKDENYHDHIKMLPKFPTRANRKVHMMNVSFVRFG